MSISYSASTTVAANPSIGDMNGANGTNGHAFGGKGAPSPSGGRGGSYRHINDLTRQPEPDLSRPISKLLDQAESDAKQAKFLADVGRIDAALEAYVRSFSLLVKDIRNHREFPSLQTERKAVHDRYNRLTGQVGKDFEAFEKIKQIIQEDNARTGVQPSGSMPQRAGDGPLNSRPQTPQTPKSGVETSRTVSLGVISPSPGKAKPAVNPKPANLHGNAIKPQSPRKDGAPAETDELKQRLANLRKSNVPPVQDPRIRTRPIPVSLPAASSSPTRDNLPSVQSLGRPSSPPRSVPQSPPRLTTSIDGVIGQLPKVPAAIYSPARGNMSTEAANLPSSTPRGMYSRSNSSAGFYPVKNNSANITKSPVSDDYFSPTGQRPSSVPPRPNRVPLPDGDTISVEELLKYQRTEHFRVLLIDVRPRSDFEDGHILSSATICIEPEIIERPRIEASDVEDSMEIGSAEEKRHFERRYDFDMVVIYDQDSQSPGLGRNRAAAKLFSILKDFDYPEGDPASKHPKLLRGGLDAWQDSMGGSALQNKSHKRRKSTYDKPWLKSPTKPIQSAEEARRWEQHLTQPENGGDETPEDDDDFTPVRNINEFLDFNVRYPPVQESMTSPVPSQIERWHSPVLPASPQRSEYPIIPSEPTRPPPAVPRRSFTGLQPSDDDQGTSAKIVARNDAASRRRAMGLSNPGNWCYANSTLQALFASGGFGEELFTSAWQNLYKPPKKDDEKIMPPQLLTKIMSNLFLWMGTGKFNTMQADTLMVSGTAICVRFSFSFFLDAALAVPILTPVRVTCGISRPVASKALSPLTKFLVAIAKWMLTSFSLGFSWNYMTRPIGDGIAPMSTCLRRRATNPSLRALLTYGIFTARPMTRSSTSIGKHWSASSRDATLASMSLIVSTHPRTTLYFLSPKPASHNLSRAFSTTTLLLKSWMITNAMVVA